MTEQRCPGRAGSGRFLTDGEKFRCGSITQTACYPRLTKENDRDQAIPICVVCGLHNAAPGYGHVIGLLLKGRVHEG